MYLPTPMKSSSQCLTQPFSLHKCPYASCLTGNSLRQYLQPLLIEKNLVGDAFSPLQVKTLHPGSLAMKSARASRLLYLAGSRPFAKSYEGQIATKTSSSGSMANMKSDPNSMSSL